MESQVEAAALAAPPARRRSFFAHLAGLYTAPGEEFRMIVQRPPVWAPLLALALVTVVCWGIWLSRADIIQVMQDQAAMSGRPAPAIPAEAQGKVAMFMRVTYGLTALLAPPLVGLVMAALYLFIFRFIVAGDVTFRQSYSVSLFSMLVPGIVVSILALVVLSAKGDWNIIPPMAVGANLGILLDRGSTAKWLYALAESVDLFNAWTIFLLAVGYGAASKRSTASVLGPVLSLWLVGVLIKVGLAAIFQH